MVTGQKDRKKVVVVGLGYVGLPLAVAFAENGAEVTGFDINSEKVQKYRNGIDVTREVGDRCLSQVSVDFTTDETKISETEFIVVAVPTPVKEDNTPDLTALIGASEVVGKNLSRGAIVVYESTVYPGVTEEICKPVLERESGLRCGQDFKIGYSPERINPADQVHRLDSIVKIVSGMDEESTEIIADTYSLIAKAGVYKAESIQVAEAAKVIENSQRDINIAFMNELSIIFHKMGIDTKSVLEAAATKWNFMKFEPGLVGGHCIGVDPYYLTYKAGLVGYHSKVILSGRTINDNMGKYVAENIIKSLIKSKISVLDARVAILGFTFKENCQDTRNTKVIDIIKELEEYGVKTVVVDDIADRQEATKLYGIDILKKNEMGFVDAVAVCVCHDIFRQMGIVDFDCLFRKEPKILFDLKGMYSKQEFEQAGYLYWRL